MMKEKLFMRMIIAAAFMIGLPAACFASAGTSAGLFLEVGASARAEGMGGAYVALANDPSAITINPAGIANIKGQQVTLMHNEYFLDLNQDYMAFVSGDGKQAFGAALQYMDDTQAGYTSNNVYTGPFKNRNYALSLAYGAKTAKLFNYGVGLKYVSSKLGGAYSASTVTLDAGLQYKAPVSGFKAGLALTNIVGGLKYINDKDPLPLTLKAGVAYEAQTVPFTVSFDTYMLRHQSPEYHVGAQYVVSELVPIRIGYNSIDINKGFTFGIGFIQENYSVDYAFVPSKDFGDTQRFSVIFSR